MRKCIPLRHLEHSPLYMNGAAVFPQHKVFAGGSAEIRMGDFMKTKLVSAIQLQEVEMQPADKPQSTKQGHGGE